MLPSELYRPSPALLTDFHRYPVGLERGLFDPRTRPVLEARGVRE